jgi:hypothetical protein
MKRPAIACIVLLDRLCGYSYVTWTSRNVFSALDAPGAPPPEMLRCVSVIHRTTTSDSVEATKTFPGSLGSGAVAGSMETCTVSLVVAPQSRRNVTALSFPFGETSAAIWAFAQGLGMQLQMLSAQNAIKSGFTI